MIFRKPYAFLIKYFKLINIILAALTIYLAYRTYNIVTFFAEFLTNRYSGNYYPGMSNIYISPIMYFIIILIFIGVAGILFLFVYKKKPTKFYVITAIFYVIFIFFLNITKNTMITIETSTITIETARIFNDLSIISLVPQIIIIIMLLLRGFGFQINQFNFEKDLRELEVSSSDNEEVEFTIKGDGVKLKRNFRRYIREFGYYLKENKFMVVIVLVALIVVFALSFRKSTSVEYEKTYKQQDIITTYNYNYQISDSIVTNLDYNGNEINNGKYYVVLKLILSNNTNEDINFDYNMFRLEVDKDYLYPLKEKEIYFIDYAYSNNNAIIRAKSDLIKPLVFEINKDSIKNNYTLKVENGTVYNGKIQKGRFNYISVTPVLLDNVLKEKTVNLNEELVFDKTNLEKTKLFLKNYSITDRFMYNYESCHNNNCQKFVDLVTVDTTKKAKTLMVFNYDYEIDPNVPFVKTSSDINGFVNYFVSLKYKIGEETKTNKCKGVTPANLNGRFVIETTSEIKEASEITMVITIRNKEYNIKLK